MGIASLILGIISIVFGWIPFICFLALILAVIGLILGIVDTIHKSKIKDSKKGVSLAGLIVSAIAIPIILFSSLVSFGIFAVIMSEEVDDDWYNDYYYDDDYLDDYFTNRDWYNKYRNTIKYDDII